MARWENTEPWDKVGGGRPSGSQLFLPVLPCQLPAFFQQILPLTWAALKGFLFLTTTLMKKTMGNLTDHKPIFPYPCQFSKSGCFLYKSECRESPSSGSGNYSLFLAKGNQFKQWYLLLQQRFFKSFVLLLHFKFKYRLLGIRHCLASPVYSCLVS